jgi:addiction module HigA family antidote
LSLNPYQVISSKGAKIMTTNAVGPVHPGEILLEEFLKPFGLSAYAAARRMHVPRTRIERLIKGDTSVTIDTAMRLSRLFRTSPEFWLNLQATFDLRAWSGPSCDLDTIEPFEYVA